MLSASCRMQGACMVIVRSESWHDVVTFTATGRVQYTRGKDGSRSGMHNAVPKMTVNATRVAHGGACDVWQVSLSPSSCI